jgi:hypothetical protein
MWAFMSYTQCSLPVSESRQCTKPEKSPMKSRPVAGSMLTRGDRALDALVVPDDAGLGQVALLGGIEADQAAHAFAVLGILARGHVHAVLVEHRSGS